MEMSEKVVRLHEALGRAGIPHAFGGAIAVDYYRVPRATIDIDLNVFIPPEEHARVIAALKDEFPVEGEDALGSEIRSRGQGKTYWGETRVDLFLATFDFHYSMSERARTVPYEGTEIPILSAEDIVLTKAIFDRTQDWADIEAVCQLRGRALDIEYLSRWLEQIIGLDDPRATRLMGLLGRG
jgi:hypothetical protein